jgi:hypothetical protein
MKEKREETAEITFAGKVGCHLLRCPEFGRWEGVGRIGDSFWDFALFGLIGTAFITIAPRQGLFWSPFFLARKLMAMVRVVYFFWS